MIGRPLARAAVRRAPSAAAGGRVPAHRARRRPGLRGGRRDPRATRWSTTPGPASPIPPTPAAASSRRSCAHTGRRRADGLVVSHQDLDHSGGVRGSMRRHAGRLARLVAARRSSDRRARAGEARAASRCLAGQQWTWDGVRFTVLHPTADEYADAYAKTNDRSCVVRIDSAHGSALLTGDIEAKSEAALVRKRPRSCAPTCWSCRITARARRRRTRSSAPWRLRSRHRLRLSQSLRPSARGHRRAVYESGHRGGAHGSRRRGGGDASMAALRLQRSARGRHVRAIGAMRPRTRRRRFHRPLGMQAARLRSMNRALRCAAGLGIVVAVLVGLARRRRSPASSSSPPRKALPFRSGAPASAGRELLNEASGGAFAIRAVSRRRVGGPRSAA